MKGRWTGERKRMERVRRGGGYGKEIEKGKERGRIGEGEGEDRERRGGQTANSQPVAVAVAGANRQQPDTSLRGQTANSNN